MNALCIGANFQGRPEWQRRLGRVCFSHLRRIQISSPFPGAAKETALGHCAHENRERAFRSLSVMLLLLLPARQKQALLYVSECASAPSDAAAGLYFIYTGARQINIEVGRRCRPKPAVQPPRRNQNSRNSTFPLAAEQREKREE